MRSIKFSRFALSLLLATTVVFTGCPKAQNTQHKIFIYTAQADSALAGVLKAVDLLRAEGKFSDDKAIAVYSLELKIVEAVDLIRARAKIGYDKASVLAILKQVLVDVREIEERGVLILNGEEKAQFHNIVNFIEFAVNSIQAVVNAAKDPSVTPEQQLAAKRSLAQKRGISSTLATDLILVLQMVLIEAFEESRLDPEAAYQKGLQLTSKLRMDLKSRIGTPVPTKVDESYTFTLPLESGPIGSILQADRKGILRWGCPVGYRKVSAKPYDKCMSEIVTRVECEWDKEIHFPVCTSYFDFLEVWKPVSGVDNAILRVDGPESIFVN